MKHLTVRDLIYDEHHISDGLYDSISHLKTKAHDNLKLSEGYKNALEEYEMILKLSQTTSKIPRLSLEKAKNILDSIKPEVNDFYSITGNHYRYSGVAGLHHFQALINGIIDDINNASVEELNQFLACILYKSHQKDRTSDRSYRSISTCPYLSKAIDRYC